LFLDSPASALIYGCAVALLGTGFTLVHVSSDFPHLGLVHYSALGAYVGYTLVELLGLSPYLGLPLAFLLGGAVNAAFYLTVVATMQRRGRKDVMLAVSTLAGSFVMYALVNIYAFWFSEATGAYAMAFSLRDTQAPTPHPLRPRPVQRAQRADLRARQDGPHPVQPPGGRPLRQVLGCSPGAS
jgi:branched-subunit amino acid ABC-type transport system permease component